MTLSAHSNTLAKAVIVCLCLLTTAFYITVWTTRDVRNNDFAAFYSGAINWKQGGSPYNQRQLCEVQARIPVTLCFPNYHPPIVLPLLALVSDQDYGRSYLRWSAVLLAVLLCCAAALYPLTNGLDHWLTLIAFLPMFFAVQGQDSFFVLLGLILFALCLRDGKNALAGMALSLTVLRPTLAIALGLPLLLANRKAFYGFFFSGAVLTLYSWALIGNAGFVDLFTALVNGTHSDPTTRPDKMYSVTGALVWLGLNERLTWIAFIAAVPAIGVLWTKRGLSVSTFALAVVVAVFASPHLHAHDLVFLIVPLIAWTSYAVLLVTFGFMASLQFGFSHLYVYLLMLAMILRLRGRQTKAAVEIVDHRSAVST